MCTRLEKDIMYDIDCDMNGAVFFDQNYSKGHTFFVQLMRTL